MGAMYLKRKKNPSKNFQFIFPYLTGLVILETTLTGARPTIKLTNDEANSGNLQRLILMILIDDQRYSLIAHDPEGCCSH